ncbi:MAG: bifunctional diaminohydroxyphosphoribosylaminopyrimidine deaminase/5-amino-6-(5-phosphoribosylamino)uracil reductase RibD [Synergistaceae bacterium]|nr:bifunctional diaminohydroxyphosphoribosylaminopyrimidine deaminase/5-amino-6-(5-phosphoribosylamino)uracil reductase RibD [Synergistaceae bacterium]
MNRALTLAKNGMGRTSPNPMVGCVIADSSQNIIGEGWHKKYGGPHAEIEAINNAHENNHDVRGSTVYVTLEPCSHYGKTPPCAKRLAAEGVSRVIIGMRDPNQLVNGQGIKILEDAGIQVEFADDDIMSQCKLLNKGFIFVHKYHRPFVSLKAAMSLDGRMCLDNNSSKWITGIEARTEAHVMRSENDAVLVGVNTILNDDPELTVRYIEGVNPLRVILDSNLKTPPDAKVISSDNKCLIITSENADSEKEKILIDKGARVARAAVNHNNHIDIKSALEYLASQGVLTLMVEGGPGVISSFLSNKLADYVKFFIAPRILGEGKGISLNMNFADVNSAFMLSGVKSRLCGNDVIIEGRLSCSPDL